MKHYFGQGQESNTNHLKPDFHYMANAMTTAQKQSDYKVEQLFFTLIALVSLEIGRCRGRNWLKAWFPLVAVCLLGHYTECPKKLQHVDKL